MISGGTFMAIIRPSADLRNHYKEISELCKLTNEPIYITVNGREDTVMVSSELLNELYHTIEVIKKINKGLDDVANGRVMSLEEAKNKLL